jgi:small subunit ribosomal protein S21
VIVYVRDNDLGRAMKVLKKKLQREGVFREMKLRRHFEKPSIRRARERAEAIRRIRKILRKRMERDGY